MRRRQVIPPRDPICLRCNAATPIRVHGICPRCAGELEHLIDEIDPYRQLADAHHARRIAIENDHSLLITQLAAIGPALDQAVKASAMLAPACEILTAICKTAKRRIPEPIER